jgi:hypothetical protein
MELTSQSYMQLRIDLEHKLPIFLRIPTFWDEIKHQWIGVLITEKTKKHIRASGKDSFELQNNFNVELSQALQSDIKDEVFLMFKPLEYWEARSR